MTCLAVEKTMQENRTNSFEKNRIVTLLLKTNIFICGYMQFDFAPLHKIYRINAVRILLHDKAIYFYIRLHIVSNSKERKVN